MLTPVPQLILVRTTPQERRAQSNGVIWLCRRVCRPMRAGERDGVDYHFVSKETFEGWIKGGHLLEHAVVYDQYKGIPRAQVEAALARGADVLLRLDVQVLLPRCLLDARAHWRLCVPGCAACTDARRWRLALFGCAGAVRTPPSAASAQVLVGLCCFAGAHRASR